MRKVTLLALALLLFSLPLCAQTLSAENFVLGQVGRLDLTGAAPGNLVFWLYSTTGAGPGTCFPSVNACLGILEPVTIADTAVTNPAGDASYFVYVPPDLPLLDLHLQAALIDYSSGVSVLTSNVVSTTLATVADYDDDFSGSSLSSEWQLLNSTLAQVNVSGGELVVDPLVGGPAATWFDDGEGVMVYRDLTGDFTMTATLRVSDPNNLLAPPPPAFRLGGLIVRDPNGTPGNRNSAHIAFGSGTGSMPMGVEHKTTLGSVSSFSILPTSQTAGELRIRRIGATIELSYRETAATPFILIASYPHPEFPPTVQVGMMSYSFSPAANVITRFDEISFTAP